MKSVKYLFRLLTPRQERVLKAYIEGRESKLKYSDRKYLINLLNKLYFEHIALAEEHLDILKQVFEKKMGVKL